MACALRPRPLGAILATKGPLAWQRWAGRAPVPRMIRPATEVAGTAQWSGRRISVVSSRRHRSIGNGKRKFARRVYTLEQEIMRPFSKGIRTTSRKAGTIDDISGDYHRAPGTIDDGLKNEQCTGKNSPQ